MRHVCRRSSTNSTPILFPMVCIGRGNCLAALDSSFAKLVAYMQVQSLQKGLEADISRRPLKVFVNLKGSWRRLPQVTLQSWSEYFDVNCRSAS